jgi:hypothetical protein
LFGKQRNALAYLINDTGFRVSQERGRVTFGETLSLTLQFVVVLLQGDGLTDNDVITGHTQTLEQNKTVDNYFLRQ